MSLKGYSIHTFKNCLISVVYSMNRVISDGMGEYMEHALQNWLKLWGLSSE